MSTTAASYLLVFRETTPERYAEMSRDERQAALERWNAWCDALAAEGRLQGGNTLAPEGRVVSAAGATRPLDGPFAETKELVAGFWMIQVRSREEAIEWARRIPFREGEVEIRQVLEDDDFGEAFTPELREAEARMRARTAELQRRG